MKIGNLNEFYNYIKSKHILMTDPSLAQVCACVDQFKHICTCKSKEKGQKLFQCNNLYISTINNFEPTTINLLSSSTEDRIVEFYDNSNHIRTISIPI